MVRKINPEELEEVLRAEGGAEALAQSIKMFQKDVAFLESHQKEWQKEHPDKWVAVYQEELVAIAGDCFKLLEVLKKKNIPSEKTARRFLSPQRMPWILPKCQESC